MSTDDEKKDKAQSGKESDSRETSTKIKKNVDLNTSSSGTGMTQQLGKPIVDKNDVAKRAAEIQDQYKQLKYQKFNQSSISSSFDDLLGPSKKADDEDKKED